MNLDIVLRLDVNTVVSNTSKIIKFKLMNIYIVGPQIMMLVHSRKFIKLIVQYSEHVFPYLKKLTEITH